MEAFARLYAELDATTSTNAKLDALKRYFAAAAPADAAWAAYFLAGGRPRQAVPARLLRQVAVTRAGIDDWLFEECYQAVGDLAETIAHVLPPPRTKSTAGLAEWVEQRLLPMRGMSPDEIGERLAGYWDELDWSGRFLLSKLIGGGFRVGVSRLLVIRALAEVAGVESKTVAQRIVGYTGIAAMPSAESFTALIASGRSGGAEAGQPYPFFLAHQLNDPPDTLGPVDQWMVEWKWDGIRGQLVRRAGAIWLWSRGEDLVTERFPELRALEARIPDGTVIDGEIVVWKDGRVRPFAALQTRIGRKSLSAKILGEAPAALLAYDLLEQDGTDLRTLPQHERRARLEALVPAVGDGHLQLSPLVSLPSWDAYARLRAESRSRGVEGFMLKRRDARYGVGRTKESGTWWKWKIDPMTVDAVLIYAQRGHGRRASLYTDYTFAVWAEDADGSR
ncbi:MAG TPA: ATP-dependent DNA ligase, partial [Casimicrobiaceae bacterium]|nr:ATP-dependent DNA ligase [Casimicrobiaceae bacterium]